MAVRRYDNLAKLYVAGESDTMAGRPASYDMDDVLEKGINLFWRKGFHTVTMNDIVTQTGINRFSFYEKFGSKEEFFQAALDRYFHVLTHQYLKEMAEENLGLGAIRNFLRNMEAVAADPGMPQGCLIVNSVLELGQSRFDLDRRLGEMKDAQYNAMLRSIRTEKQKGTMKNDKPAEVLADYLVDEVVSCLATSRISRDIAARLFGYQLEVVESW